MEIKCVNKFYLPITQNLMAIGVVLGLSLVLE